MKPHEFDNALENLVNLVQIRSIDKARSQLTLIEDVYREKYRKIRDLETERKWRDESLKGAFQLLVDKGVWTEEEAEKETKALEEAE